MADPVGKRLYVFRRKHPDGRTSLLVGLEHWNVSPERAMAFLKLSNGNTAAQGWYADDVTDNKEYRAWLRGGK